MAKEINISKQCRSFQLMIYVDQIGYRKEELTEDEQKEILRDFLRSIELEGILFYSIVHDKDLVTKLDEEGFEDKEEKPHAHLVFYSNNLIRPSTIIKRIGVNITKDDENLYKHGGFNYLNNKYHEVSKAVMYLIHYTEAAVLENKFPYDKSEVITNDNEDWFNTYKEEFLVYNKGLYVNKHGKIKELDEEDFLYNLLDEVCEIGYRLGDLDKFKEEIPRRYKYKYEKDIDREYWRGVDRRLESRDDIDVHRCSIFIYGPSDIGKTYASVHSIMDTGRKVRTIGMSSGTGAEDKVKPNESLVYDDRIPKNCLDKSDTNICELYRRGSNNRVFGGDYFIMTYNRKFDDAFRNYCKDREDESSMLSPEAKAVKSRFYIVEVDSKGNCLLIQKCTRGLISDCEKRDKKFYDFMERFERYLDEYRRDGEGPF